MMFLSVAGAVIPRIHAAALYCTRVIPVYNLKKIRTIGEGNFGKVVLAETPDGKQYAVKYIKKTDPKRNKNEHDILKCLNHLNIVRVSNIQEDGDLYAILMEYVHGMDLEKKRQKQRFSTSEIAGYTKQICKALEYMHTKQPQVFHRDLKGANIMVRNDGQVKLIDFGLAMNHMVSSGLDLSQAAHYTSNGCGTYCFMAPELLNSQAIVRFSSKSDVWALGMTLYQMVTGNFPYHNESTYEGLLRAVQRGPPALPVGCSDAMKDFYACCTKMDPHERHSAEKLLQHRFLAECE